MGSGDEMQNKTNLEAKALQAASLITSYSPNSKWANDSPAMYAIFMSQARDIMKAAGIEPEENIRCWFWQIDTAITGRKNTRNLKREHLKASPRLSSGMHHFLNDNGEMMSDDEFRILFPN